MAKRKSRKQQVPKKRKEPPLDSVFSCPYCCHAKSIRVCMKRRDARGTLACFMCGATFSCKIHNLSEPVDVYATWIDECCDANADFLKKAPHVESTTTTPTRKRAAASAGLDDFKDDDEDERILNKRNRVERRLVVPKKYEDGVDYDNESESGFCH